MNRLVLSLRNFQSISEGELTFNTGLNFIIGQSNSGKSATFRALKACLLNPVGSQRFIKKGNNKSEVNLKYNGQNIQWERTSKESNYIINGETYYKTGRSSALKILENETGFNQDANGTIMNIEEELQLPFPFGLNGSDLFKLFENVFCISDSAIILKSAKDYEKGVDNEISTLDLEEQKIKSKIKALNEFKECIDLKKLSVNKQKLEKYSNMLNDLKDGNELIKLAVKLEKADLQVEERDFSNLALNYESTIKCKETLQQVKKLHALSKELQELLEPQPINLVEYKDLINLRKTFNTLKALNKFILKEKEFKDKTSRLNELMSTKRFIENYKVELQRLNREQEEIEEKIITLGERLKEFKVCPLCHKPL